MRWQVVAFPIIILMDILVFFNFYKWQRQAIYEFNQRQMDLQVNYAVDAAVHDMLRDGTHLGTDYATWGEMTSEPEVALNTYVALLLRNFGWADTSENRKNLIDGSIPFFCVATYDGYYMYCKQTDVLTEKSITGTTTEIKHYPMVWTPKIPYSRTVWNESVGDDFAYSVYIYNLGFETYDKIEQNGDLSVSLPILKSASYGPGSVTDAQYIVNNTLTDACNNALYLGLMDTIESSWYLPAAYSSWASNNPVVSPTVLTYMSRNDGVTEYEVVTFGIGGAKIKDAEFCICYTTPAGEKLYTYSTNRQAVEDTYGVKIDYIYSTAKEAAQAGYWFDLRFRKVAEVVR